MESTPVSEDTIDHSYTPPLSMEDFHIISICGEGSFGKVYHAQSKMSNRHVAIKQVEMEFLVDRGKVGSAMREKDVL